MYNLGIVLPTAPSFSETFLKNKINGLIKYDYNISLFLNSKKGDITDLSSSVNVYKQTNVRNPFSILIAFLSTFILYPCRTTKFLFLEIKTGRNIFIALKNLLINAHIIGQPLDCLHFEFATMGINRENVAKAIGAILTISIRGYDIGLYPFSHPGCYDILWKNIDKIHTISDDLYKRALDLGLLPSTPMVKITPAIDTEIFKPKKLSKINDPIRFLSIGRLTWKKGIEYGLKSLALLKSKGINFEYKIVGEGDYKEAIIYAIHQLDLTNDVILIGQVPHEKVIQYMEWADIFIQPSIQEGFCNAVLEAQAMGLLCIVSDADGLSENVIHKKTGWVVPKRSPKSIVEQSIELINMEISKYIQIKENAIARVQSDFQLTDQIKNWVDFYKYD